MFGGNWLIQCISKRGLEDSWSTRREIVSMPLSPEPFLILRVLNLIQTSQRLWTEFLRDIVARSMSCAAPVKKCPNGMAPALVLWTSGATTHFQRTGRTMMAIALINGILYAGIAIVIFVGAMVMVMGMAAEK